MKYRPYQQKAHDDIYAGFQSNRNQALVVPTGGGKTVIMSGVIKEWNHGKILAIAHRKELVGQIALALGQKGVEHSVIGPSTLQKYVVARQRQKLGAHFYRSDAQVVVASVDTLISPSRQASLANWREQVGLWVIDECHHVVRGNKWGKATDLFPNAHGLGFTATPCRADGQGLGRHADGVFDALVEGPDMRWLIDNGYLCDYKIFAPLTDMHIEGDVGRSGDYSTNQLKAASKKSKIVGDVCESYKQFVPGKQAVVFTTDLETAADMAANYNSMGARTEVVSANTPDAVRSEVLDLFEKRVVNIIVNVDLLGEGFDCPGIEAVIMARPTESYGLYCQQFGRALRILDGKDYAVIIDHVGNVVRHGLPDAPRLWSLDSRERTPRSVNPDDEIPLRYCPSCTQPYTRVMVSCPYCGHTAEPASRGRPDQVDGDLYEMDAELLAQLRAGINKVDEDAESVRRRMLAAGASAKVAGGAAKNVRLRAEMQGALRASMQWWGAIEQAKGLTEREAQRKFYLRFGTDVLSAQQLGRPEALELANRINEDIKVAR